MKRRHFLLSLICILLLSLSIFTLTACGENEPPHTHVYDQQVINETFKASDATCEDKAEYYFSCSCGEKGTATFKHGEKLGHAYGAWVSIGNGQHKKTCVNDNNHNITENCSGGNATCIKKAVCDDCGIEYGTTKPHSYTILKQSETQHWYECTCGAYETKENHNPGAAATETTDQKCTECQYVIAPALGHVHALHLTKVDAKPQSCTEEGNNEYYTCSCGKWFRDNTATTEITDKTSVVIEKDAHEYETLKKTATEHWWECSCGDKDGLEEHHGGNATCIKKAVCDDCGIEYGTTTPHSYTMLKQSATQHRYECTCGAYETKENHKGGTATCTEKAKCSVCKTEYGEATGHDYDEVVTEPTCTEQGYTTYTCHCNHSYIDNYVGVLGHTEVIDNAVASTCTETGLTEGKHCSVCEEVLIAQEVVEATGHDYNKGLCFCGAYIAIDDSNYGYSSFSYNNGIYLRCQNIYKELWKACIDIVNSDITYDKSNSILLQLNSSSYSINYICKAFVAFTLDNPEFFFISNTIFYENGLYCIKIDEAYFDGEYRNYLIDVMDSYSQKVAEIVSNISTKNEKIKAIQKFIVESVQYEFDEEGNPSNESYAHNIIGFHEQLGVCETYSKTFKFFCDYLNIKNIIVMGKASDGQNHSWNLVEFEEGYRFSDLTFYDSVMDESYLCFSNMHVDSIYCPDGDRFDCLYPLPYGDYQGMLKLYQNNTFITSSNDLGEIFNTMTDIDNEYVIKVADGITIAQFIINQENWPTCRSISFVCDNDSSPHLMINTDLPQFRLHSDLFIENLSLYILKNRTTGPFASRMSTLDLNGHNLTIDSTYLNVYTDIYNSSEGASTIYTYASYNDRHGNYFDGGPWLYGNIDCENFIAYGFVRVLGSLNVDFLEAHKAISLQDNDERAISCNININQFIVHDSIYLSGVWTDSIFVDLLDNKTGGGLDIHIQGMVLSKTEFTINTMVGNSKVLFYYATYEVHVTWNFVVEGDIQLDVTQKPNGTYVVYFPLNDVQCFIKTNMISWEVSVTTINEDKSSEYFQLSYDKDGYYLYS